MTAMSSTTNIYLVPYHSAPPARGVMRRCSGHFATVEEAIASQEWPYDNGDDPSFFMARHHGNPLTWGVCRQQVRNTIRPGSIVVFFSFTKIETVYRYRMSAVATVANKIDRRMVFKDARFRSRTGRYLNVLIKPENGGWRYDEDDRHSSYRHEDWLWRIASHDGLEKTPFKRRHRTTYRKRWFAEASVDLAKNYVLFSSAPDETYIAPNPPQIAKANRGEHERWMHRALKQLTIDKAAALHRTHRCHLRNTGFGYSHPALTFQLPVHEAVSWRKSLIAALRSEGQSGSHRRTRRPSD